MISLAFPLNTDLAADLAHLGFESEVVQVYAKCPNCPDTHRVLKLKIELTTVDQLYIVAKVCDQYEVAGALAENREGQEVALKVRLQQIQEVLTNALGSEVVDQAKARFNESMNSN